jgi:hypothetical protein
MADSADIPEPVARYLALALPRGTRRIAVARFSQRGTLRSAPRARWMAFQAEQVVRPLEASFSWDARVQVAPLVRIRVRDELANGIASGRVSWLSLPLASTTGGEPMNAGALHRYLAEAVWYPTALVPDEALRWSPVDDRTAVATLRGRVATVSLEFRFAPSGEVTGVYTPDRWGRFGGAFRQAAWQGSFGEYGRRHGVLVPGDGEVAWTDAGEHYAVWRGAIVDIEYAWA